MATEDHNLLIRIDERVGMVIDRLDRLNGSVAKHEGRISRLERWRSFVVGGAAVIGFAAGIFVKYI